MTPVFAHFWVGQEVGGAGQFFFGGGGGFLKSCVYGLYNGIWHKNT